MCHKVLADGSEDLYSYIQIYVVHQFVINMNVNVIDICSFSVSPQLMALLCSETSWSNGYSKFCKTLSETSFTNTWKLDKRIQNRTVKCEDSESQNEVGL